MPQVITTPRAIRGMDRCRRFLANLSPEAALRADRVIADALARLDSDSLRGRPYAKDPTLRELLIPFGKSGYQALLRYEPERDAVRVLAFKHCREDQYRP